MTDSEKIVITVESDLEDLVPEFIEHKRENAEEILGCLQKGDYEKITMFGHRMKGAGAGYGFDFITEMGKVIEQGGKDRNDEQIKKSVDDLVAYLGRVEVVYE